MAMLGLLVVAGCALAGAQLAAHAERRSGYLAVSAYVPTGAVVTAADLTLVQLSAPGALDVVPVDEAAAVVGKRASEPLLPGTLVSPADLTTARPLSSADALVGANLAADQMPASLQVGDTVLVVLAGQGASGTESPVTSGAGPTSPSPSSEGGGVIATGTVYALTATSADSPGGEVVTIEVPRPVAGAVTAASADGDVSLAQIVGGAE